MLNSTLSPIDWRCRSFTDLIGPAAAVGRVIAAKITRDLLTATQAPQGSKVVRSPWSPWSALKSALESALESALS